MQTHNSQQDNFHETDLSKLLEISEELREDNKRLVRIMSRYWPNKESSIFVVPLSEFDYPEKNTIQIGFMCISICFIAEGLYGISLDFPKQFHTDTVLFYVTNRETSPSTKLLEKYIELDMIECVEPIV